MNPASVGFQCPSCVSSGRSSVRQPRTRFGASVTAGTGNATKILMGVLLGVFVLNLVSRGALLSLLVLSNNAVYAGQFWRLLTYGFTTAGLIGILMNLLVLHLIGRALESELGAARFFALYLAAGLGGATLCFVLGPPGLVGVGASSALLGLLAANTIGKYRNQEDIRTDLGLLLLLIMVSVLVSFNSYGWLGLVGGIIVGALVGAILAYGPRAHRTAVQAVGLLAVILGCLAAVVAKIGLG